MAATVLSQLAFLTVLLWSSSARCVQATSTGQDVIDWLKTKPNAFVSDKIAYQEKGGVFQMVATADIPQDTKLMLIPSTATVGKLEEDVCGTIQRLIDEYNKGKDSEYYPYMDYLFRDEQKSRLLPSGWSKEGKALLKYMLGRHLLPEEATDLSAPRCRKALEQYGNDPRLEQQAYFLIMSHTSDKIMIPGACWRNVVVDLPWRRY
jgi:hypothetical protein